MTPKRALAITSQSSVASQEIGDKVAAEGVEIKETPRNGARAL
jgi:hypothetical protein